jgi:tetratricopeptide (TPR) repeat protein
MASLFRLRAQLTLATALAVLAGCAAHLPNKSATTPLPAVAASITPVTSEDEFNTLRPEYDALGVDDPARPKRRAALEGWLVKQIAQLIDRGHPEESYEWLKQAATLWDPLELADHPHDGELVDAAIKVEKAFRKRGAHEEVLAALAIELSLGGDPKGTRARYDQVIEWLRVGGVTGDADLGAPPADARQRVIDDLEAVARIWPSPFIVDQLTPLYLERSTPGDILGLGARRGRRGGDLRELLQGAQRSSTAYDLARLYLRVSRPADAVAQLHKLKVQTPGDEQARNIVEKYASKQANPGDAINVAMLFTQSSHDDRDVALRVCRDASHRFPQAPEPRLCAGQLAKMLNQPVIAMNNFEAAIKLQSNDREAWQQLAEIYEGRLLQLASDENLDVAQLEPQLKNVEAFHAAAAKQFPGEPIKPSLAGAIFEVGRGYYNAGRLNEAVRYLERAIATEASAPYIELLAQIRLKKGDSKEAVTLFERAIQLPKGERSEMLFWRARLRRQLAEALEQLGDRDAAENTRKAALADWDVLTQMGLTADGLAAVAIEKAKLYYQLGDRDASLQSFEHAIDAQPDRGSTYADVIAFLVPRGELDEALDAYHRALGRNEVSEYLKVYCSLWIVDLARRAKQPVDPLAAAFLQSTDGGKWYNDLARWATGRETPEALEARADTPAKKAESTFYRAMLAASDGKLDEARKLWKQVVDTDMMAFFEYDMAQLYLKLGEAPTRPLLKSKPGGYKAPARKPPPDGSI